jgi:hypothetical protein
VESLYVSEFAKPWEDKSGVSSPGLKPGNPWDPPTPIVPPRIMEQHRSRMQRQGQYQPEKKFKAQEFAKLYVIDFDHRNAALRLGAPEDKALEIGRGMLNDPETLQAIQAFMARIEKDKIVSRERVLAGLLREACYHGHGASHSARVAAWGKLAKVLGMELPTEDPAKKTIQGGVMLVPMAGGIEDWERAAMGQQQQLKSDVRT